MKESYLENEHIELWIEHGIIHALYNPKLKIITLEIAKQMVRDHILKLIGNRYKQQNNYFLFLFE